MFCMNCGAQLPNNSKFCNVCGTKVQVSTSVKPVSSKKRNSRVLSLAGKSQEYDENFLLMTFVQGNLKQAAMGARDAVAEEYEHYSGLSDVANKLRNYAEKEIFERVFDRSQSIIEDILNERINRKDFINFLDLSLESYEVIEEYETLYKGIIENRNIEKQYLEYKKASRGKVVGGGFGLKGAVTGMAMAGTMNAVSGAFHSIGDSFSSMRSDSKASSSMRAVFCDQDMKGRLLDAIFWDVMGMDYYIIGFLNEMYDMDIPCYFTKRDCERVMEKIEGIAELEEKRLPTLDEIAECIFLYPYVDGLYRVALELDLNEKELEQLRVIADVFYIDFETMEEDVEYEKENLSKVQAVFAPQYANYISEHLEHNKVFEYLMENYGETLSENLSIIGEYCEIERLAFLFNASENKLVRKSREKFEIPENERVIYMYDDTISKSLDNGFVITNRAIYYKNMMFSKKRIQIEDFEIDSLRFNSNAIAWASDSINVSYISGSDRNVFNEVIQITLYLLFFNSMAVDNDNLAEVNLIEQDTIEQKAELQSSEDLVRYFEDKYMDQLLKKDVYCEYLFPEYSKAGKGKEQYKMISKIYNDFVDGEQILFFYDNTMFRNMKESFVITNLAVHYKSDRLGTGKIFVNDINSIEVKLIKLFPNLIINGNITIPVRFLTPGTDELADVIMALKN